MSGLSRHSVTEHLSRQLSERRSHALRVRSAYVALALAILADEDDANEPSDGAHGGQHAAAA